jgi:hypothetical protein
MDMKEWIVVCICFGWAYYDINNKIDENQKEIIDCLECINEKIEEQSDKLGITRLRR